jgi:hypothetical protein
VVRSDIPHNPSGKKRLYTVADEGGFGGCVRTDVQARVTKNLLVNRKVIFSRPRADGIYVDRSSFFSDPPDAGALPESWQASPTAPIQAAAQQTMNFVDGRFGDSRAFRLLNVLDDFNSKGLVIKADVSLPAQTVIRSLDRVIERTG